MKTFVSVLCFFMFVLTSGNVSDWGLLQKRNCNLLKVSNQNTKSKITRSDIESALVIFEVFKSNKGWR